MTEHSTMIKTVRRQCGKCGKETKEGTPCRCCEPSEPLCDLEVLERPRFVCGMVLSDTDLTALVDWTRSRFGLQRYRHGWGVACGLDVCCTPGKPGWVTVGSGYAVSCCGDDLVVGCPIEVDLTGCCQIEDPCADPSKPEEPQDHPCGDRVVDLYLRGNEVLAGVELVDQCGCGGDHSHSEATRLRESAVVDVRAVWIPDADPAVQSAEAWRQAYIRITEQVLSYASPEQLKGQTSEVLAWLRHQDFDPPCDWWDRVCAAMNTDNDETVEQRLVPFLLELAIELRSRHRLRYCPTCAACDGVRLARVWLRRVTDSVTSKSTCKVVLVDTFRPFRRELSLDTWPVLPGWFNLAPFVWQRWEYVCADLRTLGIVTKRVVGALTSADQLAMVLRDTADLYWSCADDVPVVIVVDSPCLGERILGFSRRSTDDDAKPVVKTTRKRTGAKA